MRKQIILALYILTPSVSQVYRHASNIGSNELLYAIATLLTSVRSVGVYWHSRSTGSGMYLPAVAQIQQADTCAYCGSDEIVKLRWFLTDFRAGLPRWVLVNDIWVSWKLICMKPHFTRKRALKYSIHLWNRMISKRFIFFLIGWIGGSRSVGQLATDSQSIVPSIVYLDKEVAGWPLILDISPLWGDAVERLKLHPPIQL